MPAARQPPDGVGLDMVDDVAERAMRSRRRTGLVIGCLAGGEQRVAGYGRVRLDAKVTPDGGTIFEIGSITKVFTALLLADLAEQGLVDVEDPLASYLPASVEVPTFGARAITLGDLASHAGGLRRNPKGMLRRWLHDRHNPYAGLSMESVYAGLARTKLRRRPGARVTYSNLGAGLLGDALARAAGQPYEELVWERICRPLGLRDTMVTPPASRPPGWPAGTPAGQGRRPHSRSPRFWALGRCARPRPTCCASCGPTSTLPTPRWRPSWSVRSCPGSRSPGARRSGWAG
jgi:CubicO group peptidase (beta-lactamase class C family)